MSPYIREFKKGDEVRILSRRDGDESGEIQFMHDKAIGCVGTIKEVFANDYKVNGVNGEYYGRNFRDENLELVNEPTPQYTQLQPKVGDKFRVVKKLDMIFFRGPGDIITYIGKDNWSAKVCDYSQSINAPIFKEKYLTTEYLEPIKDEPLTINTEKEATFTVAGSDITLSNGFIGTLIGHEFYQTAEPINKTNTITKMTNFIKNALLSADDKALIKANYLNNDLSLTSDGKQALEFIAFTEHKKALVTMAKEALAEAKADRD